MSKAKRTPDQRFTRVAKNIQVLSGDRIGWTVDRQLVQRLDVSAGDVAQVLHGTSAARGYWSPTAVVSLLQVPSTQDEGSRSGRQWCAITMDLGSEALRS